MAGAEFGPTARIELAYTAAPKFEIPKLVSLRDGTS